VEVSIDLILILELYAHVYLANQSLNSRTHRHFAYIHDVRWM